MKNTKLVITIRLPHGAIDTGNISVEIDVLRARKTNIGLKSEWRYSTASHRQIATQE